MRLSIVLFTVLLAGAPSLTAASPSVAASSDSQALVQRLVLERAATVAALQRVADEREEQLFADLAAKDRRLRAEQKAKRAAQADLKEVTAALAGVTAERQKLVDEIAARDRQFAAEIGEYRRQVASIADSPDPRKREALKRYAEGGRVEAFDDLVSIQAELDRANDKASAAGWRELGALALDLKDRGEKDTHAVIVVFEKAQQRDPEDVWGWIELRRLYQEAGQLVDAKRAAEQALAYTKSVRDREIALNELGDVLVVLGDLSGARDSFAASLKIAEELLASDPTSAEAQWGLSLCLDKLAGVMMLVGDLSGARARFESSIGILETVSTFNPSNTEILTHLSLGLNKLGYLLISQNDLPGAVVSFRGGVKIAEKLVSANPNSAVLRRLMSVNLNNLGTSLEASGDLSSARSCFESSLKIAEELASSNPTSEEAQRDLSVSLEKLGQVLASSGELSAARVRLEASLKIRESLAALGPSARAQRDVSASLSNLGEVLALSDDLTNARARFESSLKISKALAASDPSNAELQRDLILANWKLALLLEDETYWKEALRVAEELKEQGRLAPGDEAMLESLRQVVAAPRLPEPPP